MFVLNHYVSARDNSVFAEADRFIPERWLRADGGGGAANDSNTAADETDNLQAMFSDDLKQRPAFGCCPFGYGSRSCLGQSHLLRLLLSKIAYSNHCS